VTVWWRTFAPPRGGEIQSRHKIPEATFHLDARGEEAGRRTRSHRSARCLRDHSRRRRGGTAPDAVGIGVVGAHCGTFDGILVYRGRPSHGPPPRSALAAFDYPCRILRWISFRHPRSPQLFTENTLTVVLPLLLRKDLSTLLPMLRLWGVVLAANLVGTFLFALYIEKIDVFDVHTDWHRPPWG
jgi:hypothetical protein